jgi:hypothetical protein
MIKLGKFQEEFDKLDFDLQVHSLMLIDISKEIALLAKKKIDENKLIACCVLHDCKNHEDNHALASAEYAKKFLEKNKFNPRFIEQVYDGIYNHTEKPKTKDLTIACFYDADILCRFYALGVLRAWNNIKTDKTRDWKSLFEKISKKESLEKYLETMKKKLQIKESRKLLDSKREEYFFSHELIRSFIEQA